MLLGPDEEGTPYVFQPLGIPNQSCLSITDHTLGSLVLESTPDDDEYSTLPMDLTDEDEAKHTVEMAPIDDINSEDDSAFSDLPELVLPSYFTGKPLWPANPSEFECNFISAATSTSSSRLSSPSPSLAERPLFLDTPERDSSSPSYSPHTHLSELSDYSDDDDDDDADVSDAESMKLIYPYEVVAPKEEDVKKEEVDTKMFDLHRFVDAGRMAAGRGSNNGGEPIRSLSRLDPSYSYSYSYSHSSSSSSSSSLPSFVKDEDEDEESHVSSTASSLSTSEIWINRVHLLEESFASPAWAQAQVELDELFKSLIDSCDRETADVESQELQRRYRWAD